MLLQGMLQPDPKKRMPLSQILQNPWFADGLPPGVLEMNMRLPEGPEDGHGQVQNLLGERQPLHLGFLSDGCVIQSTTSMVYGFGRRDVLSSPRDFDFPRDPCQTAMF